MGQGIFILLLSFCLSACGGEDIPYDKTETDGDGQADENAHCNFDTFLTEDCVETVTESMNEPTDDEDSGGEESDNGSATDNTTSGETEDTAEAGDDTVSDNASE